MKAKTSPNEPATKADVDRLRMELTADITTADTSLRTEIKKATSSLRTEIKKTEKLLRGEVVRVGERVEKLEEKVDVIEMKIDGINSVVTKISIQLDGFVGRVDDLTNDNEIGTEQISVLQAKVKDHDKRIVKLESRN